MANRPRYVAKLVFLALILSILAHIGVFRLSKLLEYRPAPDNVVTNDSTGRYGDILKEKELQTTATIPSLLKSTAYDFPLDIQFVMHNPELCSNKTLDWIVYVHSATRNADKRHLLRSTWANVRLLKSYRTELVFMLGMTPDVLEQEAIENEQRTHGDIVQGDFLDTYRNLTLKAVMSVKWVSIHCPNAPIVIKVDDDVFIDIFNLSAQIRHSFNRKKRFIACLVARHAPILRNMNSKWAVEATQLQNKTHYPLHCMGVAYIMPIELVKEIYHTSLLTPFFWIDDVFLTGFVLEMMKPVEFVNLSYTRKTTLSPPNTFLHLTRNRDEFLARLNQTFLDPSEVAHVDVH